MKKCNMKKVQHWKSATWPKCNTKRGQHEKRARREKHKVKKMQHEKSGKSKIWKKCTSVHLKNTFQSSEIACTKKLGEILEV